MSSRPLLITGVGRSGTVWASHALNVAGVPCTHETRFNPYNQQLFGWSAESSWLAAPYVKYLSENVWVVRLVRDPRKVVGSWLVRGRIRGSFNAHYAYLLRFVPELALIDDPLSQIGWMWVRWNRMFQPHEVAKLEDITADDVGRWARLVDPDAVTPDELPGPVHVSRRPPKQVTWDHLTHVPHLLEMARGYGYL